MTDSKKIIRCAVYTRVSNNDDKEHMMISSVDAQRQACAGFIKAHRGVGWVMLPEYYTDEGYSGAVYDRPALNKLKHDVTEGKIDKVVVYRFDRIARDVKIHILFDELLSMHNADSISVMEGYDKNTALGRMEHYSIALHAQYEREIAIERTIDKIAISKQAGLWMGGVTPFGYKAKDKKLFIYKKEAEIVRFIFSRFIETKSVIAVVKEAQEKGYKGKVVITKNGKIGGKIIDKGKIHFILNNNLYIGQIKHKGKSYKGIHEPIISKEQWGQAHQIMRDNRINNPVYKKEWKTPSYLRGILECGTCHSGMILHSTTKRKTGKQYRYYTPNAIMKSQCNECQVRNILADEIEAKVITTIGMLLKTPDMTARVISKLQSHGNSNYHEGHVVAALASFEELWKVLQDGDRFKIIRSVVEKVFLYPQFADIVLKKDDMAGLFDRLIGYINSEVKEADICFDIISYTNSTITIRITDPDAKKRRNKSEVRITLPDTQIIETAPLPQNFYKKILVKTIAQAFYWSDLIENGEAAGIEAIAKRENVDLAYIIRLLKLTKLAPDIIHKILAGTQPKELQLKHLIKDMPDLWQEQRMKLDFSN